MADQAVERANGITAEVVVTDDERQLRFDRDGTTAVIAEPRQGYAMLIVRDRPDGAERERYYGFDMALDHAAELLGVDRRALPVPPAATDMGI